MDTTAAKGSGMSKATTKHSSSDIFCTVCRREIADCTIGGAHGMLRDRTAAFYRQMRAEGKIK